MACMNTQGQVIDLYFQCTQTDIFWFPLESIYCTQLIWSPQLQALSLGIYSIQLIIGIYSTQLIFSHLHHWITQISYKMQVSTITSLSFCPKRSNHYFPELHEKMQTSLQHYFLRHLTILRESKFHCSPLLQYIFCTKANFTAILYFNTYFALLLCTNPRPSLHVLERIHDNDAHIHISQYPCAYFHTKHQPWQHTKRQMDLISSYK